MRFCHALAIGLTGLAISSPAGAILAPSYQRLAELKAVLSHPGVIGAFEPAEPIDRIEFIRDDLYRVSAGRCHLDVAIVDKPQMPGRPGLREFEVKPGPRVCS